MVTRPWLVSLTSYCQSYDGLKVKTYAEGDARGDYDEHSAQFLWGGEIGEIDVVIAGQFRRASRLAWDERPNC